jgi:hypothetical protein
MREIKPSWYIQRLTHRKHFYFNVCRLGKEFTNKDYWTIQFNLWFFGFGYAF